MINCGVCGELVPTYAAYLHTCKEGWPSGKAPALNTGEAADTSYVGSNPTPSAHTRNSKQLDSFVEYCRANPEQRFWQALRNWSGAHRVVVQSADGQLHDMFYEE